MMVRTLREHGNGYGARFQKVVGEEYDHPTPKQPLADGLVEEVKADGEVSGDGENARVSRVREGTERTAEGDGKKRAAAGGKASDGKDGGPGGSAGA